MARQMMTAARTAPKGKGVDIIEIAMVTDGDINILSEMMVKMVAEHGMKFFLRDAENILNAECVLLIGTHEQAQGLNCGHCGYATCVSRKEGVPCALNSVDVGIAIGALAGVVNGVLISYLHLPAMLVTYGVREILRGVAYAYMNGGVITSDLTSGYYNTYFVGGLRLS